MFPPFLRLLLSLFHCPDFRRLLSNGSPVGFFRRNVFGSNEGCEEEREEVAHGDSRGAYCIAREWNQVGCLSGRKTATSRFAPCTIARWLASRRFHHTNGRNF